jgi:bifunctional non-homologous end joining protein LigD
MTKTRPAKRAPERKAIAIGNIRGAVKAPMPSTLAPQLATLAAGVPSRGEWLYEIKFDGYRILTRFDNGKPALLTRRGHDWSSKMPQLVRELKTIGIQSGWLDGEIVVLNDAGVPDFNALQNSLDQRTSSDLVYFLFDVPFQEGYDLRQARLSDRRALLQARIADKARGHVRFSDTFEGDPRSILASACRMGLEGIIAKRANGCYVSKRTEDWLKLKCKKRQEFLIIGYHDRAGAVGQVGSLILGVYDNGELIPVGSVGTGWNAEEAARLKTQLARIEQDTPSFAGASKKPGRFSKRKPGGERWVKPMLVAKVEFADWTPEGQVRHASFISLRSDKPAKAVRRELPKATD